MQTPDKQVSSEEYFRQLKNDYETVFSTDAGKRVLEDIERAGFINITTTSPNPYYQYRNEGMREMALHIMGMAKPEPKEKKKQKEAKR